MPFAPNALIQASPLAVIVRHLHRGEHFRVHYHIARDDVVFVKDECRDHLIVAQRSRRVERHRAADVVEKGRRVRQKVPTIFTGCSLASVPISPTGPALIRSLTEVALGIHDGGKILPFGSGRDSCELYFGFPQKIGDRSRLPVLPL